MHNQVISFLQSKGGAGKTTSLVAIATHMQRDGAKCAIIDTDPNKDVYEFCEMFDYPFEYGYVDSVENIKSAIEHLKAQGFDAIFVDTAGADSQMQINVAALSDLVIITAIPSFGDVKQAIKTFKAVYKVVTKLEKQIDIKTLLVDVDVDTNITESVFEGIEAAGMPVLRAKINHYTGFRELKMYGTFPTGRPRKNMNAVMCELQMKQFLSFYNKY